MKVKDIIKNKEGTIKSVKLGSRIQNTLERATPNLYVPDINQNRSNTSGNGGWVPLKLENINNKLSNLSEISASTPINYKYLPIKQN